MIGGQAFSNGVAFYTDEIWVKAFRDQNQTIIVETRPREISQGYLMKWLGSIPFVRGLARVCELVMTQRRLLIAIFLSVFVSLGILVFCMGNTLFQNVSSDSVVGPFSWSINFFFPTILLIAMLIIRFTGISRFHGAEHQMITAYETYHSIERDKVLAATRVSSRCGSNLVVFEMLCFCLLSLLPLALWLKILLSYMVGYELFLLDDRGRWGWGVIPFYRISGWMQQWVLTSKPTDQELEVAESAFLALLEKAPHL